MSDIILRKEQVLYGTSGDKELVRYRHFESYDGMKQAFQATTYPTAYYSGSIAGITSFTNMFLYNVNNYGHSGCAVSNYELGTSSPATPKRSELLRDRYYNSDVTMYFINMNIVQDTSMFDYAEDVNGNHNSYKIKGWIGWRGLYNANGTEAYSNPVISATTLSNVHSSLVDPSPYYQANSYAFGHFYLRLSSTTITGLINSNGNSTSSYVQYAFQGNYVVNGCSKDITIAAYKGDGYNPTYYKSYIGWIIPGDYNDTTDPDTYFIYGYVATAIKLYPYSYVNLSNYGHTTRLNLTYIGDDNAVYASNGQSTTSASGFLNFTSGSQDRNDGLRYIYKFCSQFSRGFIANVSNDSLLLGGIKNVIVFVTCSCGVSCAPTGVNYTINMRYSFQVLDKNNNVLQTTGTFTHSINVGTITGYDTTFYDASTIVVQEYPIYYKIKITKVEWSRDNTTYNNYINCNLVKNVVDSDGRAKFGLIVYDPPIMQNPW